MALTIQSEGTFSKFSVWNKNFIGLIDKTTYTGTVRTQSCKTISPKDKYLKFKMFEIRLDLTR